jgi:hypothetical protein
VAEPNLTGVIVGGLLTVLGGAVGSALTLATKYFDVREDQERKRAEYFQELVELVYSLEHWLDKKRQIEVFEGKGDLGQSPLATLESIAAVYFPQFTDSIREMATASFKYEAWMGMAVIHPH